MVGEYGRQFIEFVIVISAPTFAPHLDQLLLACVAIALAALVTMLVIRMTGIRFSPSDLPVVRACARAPRQHKIRTGDEAQARAPTVEIA